MAALQDILNYPLFSIAGTLVDVATLLTAVAVGLLSLWLSFIAEKATGGFMRRQGIKDEGSIGATARLVYYIVLCVGLSVAVHTLGINLTALFAAGAIFAIALGFAMQNITQNFVSGVILLLERTIKPGDSDPDLGFRRPHHPELPAGRHHGQELHLARPAAPRTHACRSELRFGHEAGAQGSRGGHPGPGMEGSGNRPGHPHEAVRHLLGGFRRVDLGR
jgi:hypothetical protein